MKLFDRLTKNLTIYEKIELKVSLIGLAVELVFFGTIFGTLKISGLM